MTYTKVPGTITNAGSPTAVPGAITSAPSIAYVEVPASSDALLLDGLSVAPNALWCRSARLLSAYTAALTRVRRASDSSAQDVPYLAATNRADTAGMATFCGASSGYEPALYDQSGNARDLAQATTANQPKLHDSATGPNLLTGDLASLHDAFDDGQTRADRCGLGAVGPAITLWAVWTTTATSGFRGPLRLGTPGAGGALFELYMDNTTTRLALNIGGGTAKFDCAALNTGVNSVVAQIAAGAGIGSARMWLNGSELTLTSSTNPANTITALGNTTRSATGDGGYGQLSGNCDALGVWGSALGAGDIATLFAASTALHGVP